MANWSGSDDECSRRALDESVRLGCNFFDSAWAYGEGHSDRLLGGLVRAHPDSRLYTASKVPPANRQWPSRREFAIDDVFPSKHIREYTDRILTHLDLERVDLMQFHVWEDSWVRDDGWQRTVSDLRDEGRIGGAGISINRWEPWNGLDTVRSGVVDAVQVIYNIFDQSAEDELLPLCQEHNVAVIARVPFDEGSLTGALSMQSRWPDGDFRRTYFGGENLGETVRRVEELRGLAHDRSAAPARRAEPGDAAAPESLAAMALRFILGHPAVSTVIPGMRSISHVRENIAASEAGPLSDALMDALRRHRWDRSPTAWSH